MYEVHVYVPRSKRQKVRQQIEETGLGYEESRYWRASRFTIRTSCADLYQMLQEWFTELGSTTGTA